MTILAFDTSLGALSAAVDAGALGIVGRLERRRTGHAEALMPMIADVLAETGTTPRAVTRIAVTEGPGGFTSVRIAIAAARGLALATGADTVTTSSLHLMALEAAERLTGQIDTAAGLIVAEDARRGEVFAQRFDAAGAPTGPVMLASLATIDEFLLASGTIAVGGAAPLVAAAARRYSCHATLVDIVPDARRLAKIAAHLVPVAKPRPLYLRPPDARPQTLPTRTVTGARAE